MFNPKQRRAAIRMAAPFYALARRSPCSSDPDRVAVIPAAIYVTYTWCGDGVIIIQIAIDVKFSAVWRVSRYAPNARRPVFDASHKRQAAMIVLLFVFVTASR